MGTPAVAEPASVEEPDNIRFRFGDLLLYTRNRFLGLFPEQTSGYSEEEVRRMLRPVMPQLEKNRFLAKIDPPDDERIEPDDTLYECLPALWHYSVQRISRPLARSASGSKSRILRVARLLDSAIRSGRGGDPQFFKQKISSDLFFY